MISSGGGAPGTSWKETLPFLEGTERVLRRLGASCAATQSGLVGNKVSRKGGRAKGKEGEREKKGREGRGRRGRERRRGRPDWTASLASLDPAVPEAVQQFLPSSVP